MSFKLLELCEKCKTPSFVQVNRRKDKKCIGVKPRFICEFMLAVETAKMTLMAYGTNGTGLNTMYTGKWFMHPLQYCMPQELQTIEFVCQ